jgi:L,D-transpeptidase ErfK/SrfK
MPERDMVGRAEGRNGRAFAALSLAAVACASLIIHGADAAHERYRRPATFVGGTFVYTVRQGDTLRTTAARYGTSGTAIARDNGLAADARLSIGQVIRVDNRHIVPAAANAHGLVVNVPQKMLFAATADELEAYPVAVGRRGWPTPTGDFVVIAKERDPTWDVPPSILEESRRTGSALPGKVPPGPNNPLGAFWIGLSLPGIGIHGTNAPSSIFRAATHGCIRMHPDDIASLFDRVGVGTVGRTIYEPVLLAEHEGALYLEVHPDIYRRESRSAPAAARALAQQAGWTERVDWAAADAVASAADGVARNVSAR